MFRLRSGTHNRRLSESFVGLTPPVMPRAVFLPVLVCFARACQPVRGDPFDFAQARMDLECPVQAAFLRTTAYANPDIARSGLLGTLIAILEAQALQGDAMA